MIFVILLESTLLLDFPHQTTSTEYTGTLSVLRDNTFFENVQYYTTFCSLHRTFPKWIHFKNRFWCIKTGSDTYRDLYFANFLPFFAFNIGAQNSDAYRNIEIKQKFKIDYCCLDQFSITPWADRLHSTILLNRTHVSWYQLKSPNIFFSCQIHVV